MNLPDFVCIGAQKAGTTWLHAMLSQNPDVWLPPLKELHYFDRALWSDERKLATAKRSVIKATQRVKNKVNPAGRPAEKLNVIDDNYLTEEWYRGVFSAADRVGKCAGEITPSYLMLKKPSLKYLHSLMPGVKIILFIREPLARDLSQLRMLLERSRTDPQSEEEWQAVLERFDNRGQRGNYQKALERWWSFYPRDQFLILPFGMIKKNPAEMIRRVESFLGVSHFGGYESMRDAVHASKRVPIPQWVIDRFKERAEPQLAFLRAEFGEEFLASTS